MTASRLRVEQVLRMLPAATALEPLRTALLASVRADRQLQWASAAPYLTAGKHLVQPEALRNSVALALEQERERLRTLYDACLEAIRAREQGDLHAAATAFLLAGDRERRLNPDAALPWFEAANALAALLPERALEVACLQRQALMRLLRGDHAEAARHYQRSLVLAEAEFDQAGVVAASLGLGDAAAAADDLTGASAWYERAGRLAEAAADEKQRATISRRKATVARRRNNWSAALELSQEAAARLATLNDPEGAALATVEAAEAQLALSLLQAASTSCREALAWLQQAGGAPALEIRIRFTLADVSLTSGRPLDAERALRQAETTALTAGLMPDLVETYERLGGLRARQRDEHGYVFFEQALEFCREAQLGPRVEGTVYSGYGMFRHQLGQNDEARACFERASALFTAAGDTNGLDRVRAELAELSA